MTIEATRKGMERHTLDMLSSKFSDAADIEAWHRPEERLGIIMQNRSIY